MRPHLFLWMPILGAALAQPAAVAQSRPVAPSAFVTQVQNSGANGAWRSPKSSLDEFPLLGADDCSRYGADYGYSECTAAAKAKASTAARAEPPAAEAIAEPPPQEAPVPMRRSAALKGDVTLTDVSPPGADPVAGPVAQRIREITGDLLLARFDGQAPSDAGPQQSGAALRSGAIAGVVLRASNIANAGQLRTLTGFFRVQSDTPPIILAERPGGTAPAWAAERGFKPVPAAADIGERADALDAFNRYRDMGAELSSLGINLNLGPSAEPCAEGGEAVCFGSAPQHVAALATAFNYGHHDARVMTALRGHRSADAAASLEAMRDMLRQLAPDALVVPLPEAGDAAFVIATARIRALRESGFNGTVIAELAESAGPVDLGEAAVRALTLGADMVVAGDAASAADFNSLAVGALNKAVESGQLVMARIEDAHSHAGQLQDRLRIWTANPASQNGDVTSSTAGASAR